MHKSILVLLAPLLVLQSRAEAMQLEVGDVYEWSRVDIATMASTPLRATLLSQGASEHLPTDSGTAWKVRIDIDGAPRETLELFRFKDGGMRWTRPGTNFPVELESPRTASRSWNRGRFYWGLPEMGRLIELSGNEQFTTNSRYDTSSSGGIARVRCEAKYPLDLGIGKADISGIWTDSVGPVWIGSGERRFFLVSMNGKAIASTALMDSLRKPPEKIRKQVAGYRYPRLDDRYTWAYIQHQWMYAPAPMVDTSDTTWYAAVVTAAPPDSEGWSRRVFDVRMTMPSGKDTSWTGTLRWNALGSTAYTGRYFTPLVSSWSARLTDTLIASGAYFIRSSYMGTTTAMRTVSSSHEYILPTGELMSLFGGTSKDFTGMGCTMCSEGSSWEYVLVSAPGHTVGTAPRRTSSPQDLDARSLQTLVASDPDATVRWTTLSGQSGQTSLKEYMRAHAKPGVVWLRVKTSDGKVRQGMILTK